MFKSFHDALSAEPVLSARECLALDLLAITIGGGLWLLVTLLA